MFQTTITIIIVLAAGIIALIRFVRFFTVPLEKCGGCSQSGGGCSMEVLKKEIEMKRSQKGNLEYPQKDAYHRTISD
jgi:hypothetical protein